MTGFAPPVAALTVFLFGAVCAPPPTPSPAVAVPAVVVPAKTLTPVTADYEVEESRVLADGNVLQHKTTGVYYRDGHGRVRREQGTIVVVNDPVAGTTLILNTAARTARKTTSAPRTTSAPQRQQAPNVIGASGASAVAEPAARPETAAAAAVPLQRAAQQPSAATGESLGSRVVEGLAVRGRRFVSFMPAGSRLGNTRPIRMAVEVWASDEAQLPILTVVQNPLTGNKTQRFKNIRRGVEPDPKLFEIPAGYQVLEAKPASAPPPR